MGAFCFSRSVIPAGKLIVVGGGGGKGWGLKGIC